VFLLNTIKGTESLKEYATVLLERKNFSKKFKFWSVKKTKTEGLQTDEY